MIQKKFILFAALLCCSLVSQLATAAEETAMKENVLKSIAGRIVEKQQAIGKFQFIETQQTHIQALQEITIVKKTRVSSDGTKITEQELLEASMNGKEISQQKMDQIQDRFQGLLNWQEKMAPVQTALVNDQFQSQISLMGEAISKGSAVYRLKYVPFLSQTLQEVDFEVDKASYDLVTMDIIAKATDTVKNSRIHLEYQKSINGYSLPALVTIKSQIQKRRLLTVDSQISLNDYRKL
ncbi:MAG TPA: hypothetical protein DDW65_04170 [Firmicutes bacterium]|nr:hypothetical protein [Bacillota bacterium]